MSNFKFDGREELRATGWSTEAEMEFISGLGRWTIDTRMKRDRAQSLMGYIASLSERKHWGSLNPAKLREFAENELQKIISENA